MTARHFVCNSWTTCVSLTFFLSRNVRPPDDDHCSFKTIKISFCRLAPRTHYIATPVRRCGFQISFMAAPSPPMLPVSALLTGWQSSGWRDGSLYSSASHTQFRSFSHWFVLKSAAAVGVFADVVVFCVVVLAFCPVRRFRREHGLGA